MREDLGSDWESAQPRRDLQADRLTELHPLHALPHPIVAKAASAFTDNPLDDNYVGSVLSSTKIPLLEIKVGQWRGGIWHDSDLEVCWILVAGLAKGGHEDRDDFYQRVARENAAGNPLRWLPTDEDVWLLKCERAAQILTDWELLIQKLVLDALRLIQGGGTARFELPHPIVGRGRMAAVALEISEVRDDGYEADEVFVEIVPEPSHAGGDLFWQSTLRVLTTLNPPQEGWDRYRNTYNNIAEPGRWPDRVVELEDLVAREALAESAPGETAHYAHRNHIAGSVVEGTAIRALCGVFFVNTRPPENLTSCPECADRWDRLPK